MYAAHEHGQHLFHRILSAACSGFESVLCASLQIIDSRRSFRQARQLARGYNS